MEISLKMLGAAIYIVPGFALAVQMDTLGKAAAVSAGSVGLALAVVG